MRETKLLFCGDVCFRHQKNRGPGHAASILSELETVLDSADKVIINLETPLAPDGVGAPITKSGPALISDPSWVDFLEEAGCGLAVMANNHTGDYGEDALSYTTELLTGHSIPYIGAGSDIDEAYSAYRFTSNGTSVSIIAVCENEFGTAGKSSAGTAGYAPERIGSKIAEEKLVSDKVIVVFHGGCEKSRSVARVQGTVQEPRQTRRGRRHRRTHTLYSGLRILSRLSYCLQHGKLPLQVEQHRGRTVVPRVYR